MSRALSLVSLFTGFKISFFLSFLPSLILESSRSTCCRLFYSFPFSIKDRFKAEFEITSLARSRTRNRHNERTNDSQKSHTYGNNNKRMGKRKDIHTRTGTHYAHGPKDSNVHRSSFPFFNWTQEPELRSYTGEHWSTAPYRPTMASSRLLLWTTRWHWRWAIFFITFTVIILPFI